MIVFNFLLEGIIRYVGIELWRRYMFVHGYVVVLTAFIIFLLYFTVLDLFNYGTVGKRITRLMVINKYGKRISFKQAFLRSLISAVIGVFGIFAIIFSGKAIQDIWTETDVVLEKEIDIKLT